MMDYPPSFDGAAIVQDYSMRITIHPQPLLARSNAGRRNYFMPMCETEWIQMVNKLDRGKNGQDSTRGTSASTTVQSRASSIRSVSANSYFDPYTNKTMGTGAKNSNSSQHAQPANQMSRHQMQRAYERACSQSAISRNRTRAISSRTERQLGNADDSPLLVTRSAPLISRSTTATRSRGGCTRASRNSSRSTIGDDDYDEDRTTTVFLNLNPQTKREGNVPSRREGHLPSRREAWYSAPFRSRIVKQSPPWRSLMNQRPQGMRASGDLCPNHCRCCFEGSYDPSNKNVYRIDLK